MASIETHTEIDEEKDTVNAALREVGQRQERLRALARLRPGCLRRIPDHKAPYRS